MEPRAAAVAEVVRRGQAAVAVAVPPRAAAVAGGVRRGPVAVAVPAQEAAGARHHRAAPAAEAEEAAVDCRSGHSRR